MLFCIGRGCGFREYWHCSGLQSASSDLTTQEANSTEMRCEGGVM